MRIEIDVEIETKLLQDAAKIGLSPTKYITFLVRNIEIRLPEIEVRRESPEKLVVTLPPAHIEGVELQKQVNRLPRGSGFVKNY